MKDSSNLRDDTIFINEELWESEHGIDSMRRMRRIFDTKYQKANLRKIVSNSKHLNKNEQIILRELLTKYEFHFEWTIGIWKTKPEDIEIQLGSKPYHYKSYPVPRSNKAVFRKEVERLCQLGVLKKVNRSEWEAHTFI